MKKYSCYSSTHPTYSHRFFFLVSALMKCKIKYISYDVMLLLDHTPKTWIYHNSKLMSEWHIPKWRSKQKICLILYLFLSSVNKLKVPFKSVYLYFFSFLALQKVAASLLPPQSLSCSLFCSLFVCSSPSTHLTNIN